MTTALEQQREDQALGAAWRRCEAALPEGWTFQGLSRIGGWFALALGRHRKVACDFGSIHDEFEKEGTHAETPIAALEALAEALEARAAE